MTLRIMLVVGLCLLSACTLTEQQVIKNTADATIYVGNELGHGTGYLVKNPTPNSIILTNFHVCDLVFQSGLNPVFIHGTHRITLPLKGVTGNPNTDICAIELGGKLVEPHYELPVANDYRLNQEVYVIGYPRSFPLTIAKGYTGPRAPDPLHFGFEIALLYVRIFPGNSGSAVVNTNGEIIGMVSEGDYETNYGAAVTLDSIKEFLRGLFGDAY